MDNDSEQEVYSEYLKVEGGYNFLSHTMTLEELNLVLGEYLKTKAQAASALPYNVAVTVRDIEIDHETGEVYVDIAAVATESMN